jgi:hypothetical protein
MKTARVLWLINCGAWSVIWFLCFFIFPVNIIMAIVSMLCMLAPIGKGNPAIENNYNKPSVPSSMYDERFPIEERRRHFGQ